jgi:hypothetical protein
MMDEEGIEREESIVHKDNDMIQVYLRNIGSQFKAIGFTHQSLEKLNDLTDKDKR